MALPKGRTNNPKGRPRTEDCAANAIRKAITPEDWKRMAKSMYLIVVDPLQDGKNKAACYNALADRAFGKPVQKQIIQPLPAPPVDEIAIKEMQAALGLPELSTGIEAEQDDSDVEEE